MAKVKVKVAVAVDSTGDWVASGWKHPEPSIAKILYHTGIIDSLNGVEETFYWLEAELDIPETSTIVPEVTKAEKPE